MSKYIDMHGMELCIKVIKYVHQLQNIVYEMTSELVAERVYE